MDAGEIEKALKRLGECFECHCDVELLLVGSAAALLTGVLKPTDTTTRDCDVLRYEPSTVWGALELAAERLSDALGLAPNWLNSDVQGRLEARMLPDGWETRRCFVDQYGRLRVFAISRPDIIATKFLAHRTLDREHLARMNITPEDLGFVRQYLEELTSKGERAENVAEAIEFLDAWESGT